jgi:hypothetical protein
LFNQGSTDEIRTAAGGAALKLEKRFFYKSWKPRWFCSRKRLSFGPFCSRVAINSARKLYETNDGLNQQTILFRPKKYSYEPEITKELLDRCFMTERHVQRTRDLLVFRLFFFITGAKVCVLDRRFNCNYQKFGTFLLPSLKGLTLFTCKGHILKSIYVGTGLRLQMVKLKFYFVLQWNVGLTVDTHGLPNQVRQVQVSECLEAVHCGFTKKSKRLAWSCRCWHFDDKWIFHLCLAQGCQIFLGPKYKSGKK